MQQPISIQIGNNKPVDISIGNEAINLKLKNNATIDAFLNPKNIFSVNIGNGEAIKASMSDRNQIIAKIGNGESINVSFEQQAGNYATKSELTAKADISIAIAMAIALGQ
jgi:hypothetical protein